MSMQHTYDGPIPHLKGATAILQQTKSKAHNEFMAQFDDVTLSLEGRVDQSKENWQAHSLGYGWHGPFRVCPGRKFI